MKEEIDKPRYQELTDLIDKWLNEPGDYDIDYWAEIEELILKQKFELRKPGNQTTEII